MFLYCYPMLIKGYFDQFIQGWTGRLNISSRASLYTYISSFKFKPYLDICNIPKFIYSVTRVSVSSHRLNTECGRWARPNIIPVNERKCQNGNALEDEYHFVLECSLYNELKKQYIPSLYRNNPSMQKCIQLLSIENPLLLINLIYYVYKAFGIRTNSICINI